jgi:hypothetical protein
LAFLKMVGYLLRESELKDIIVNYFYLFNHGIKHHMLLKSRNSKFWLGNRAALLLIDSSPFSCCSHFYSPLLRKFEYVDRQ